MVLPSSAFTIMICHWHRLSIASRQPGAPSFCCHQIINFHVVLHRVLIQLVTAKGNSKQLLDFRPIQEPDTRLSWGDADGPELFNMDLSALVLVGHSPAATVAEAAHVSSTQGWIAWPGHVESSQNLRYQSCS